jgi:hypothetical protein
VGSPVQSLERAVQLSRALPPGPRTVLLAGGTYFLQQTLVLTAADSHLTIAARPGEKVVVSGGLPGGGGLGQGARGRAGLVAQGLLAARHHTLRQALHAERAWLGLQLLQPWDGGPVPRRPAPGRMHSPEEAQRWQQAGPADAPHPLPPPRRPTAPPPHFTPLHPAGGQELRGLQWRPHQGHPHIVAAKLLPHHPRSFNSLYHAGGRRAVRARWPDANPETSGHHTLPSGYIDRTAAWVAAHPAWPAPALACPAVCRPAEDSGGALVGGRGRPSSGAQLTQPGAAHTRPPVVVALPQ